MTRGGALTWWGVELPREIAYLINDRGDTVFKPVTYKAIFAEK